MDYEGLLEAFYTRLPLNGATVIDVGAHTGRHAIPLAAQVGVSGVVHAFEPIPEIRGRLTQNLESAEVNNVVVYPFALASKPAEVQFHYIPNLPQESGINARYMYNSPTDPPKLLKLYAHSLDDIFPNTPVAFIKIDIEGGELDMLEGSGRTLTISRPIVSFECGAASFLGYHDRPQDLFRLFHDRGYAVYSILGTQIADEHAFREAAHAQEVWDYVAVPLEKANLAHLLAS
jgi:FkbM family methyltransferase